MVSAGARDIEETLRSAEMQWKEGLVKDMEETRLEQPEHLVLRHADDAVRELERLPRAYAEPLVMGTENQGVDLPERSYRSFGELFSGRPDTDRPWQQLVSGLRGWLGKRDRFCLPFLPNGGGANF